MSKEWASGLFSCLEDCQTCCYGLFCPCCLFGANIEELHENRNCCSECCWCVFCSVVGCGCCYGARMRKEVRDKYDLRESPTSDCCAYLWCGMCAICQEAREIKRQKTMPPVTGDVGSYQPPVGGREPQSYPAPVV